VIGQPRSAGFFGTPIATLAGAGVTAPGRRRPAVVIEPQWQFEPELLPLEEESERAA
jgi:hypothetical protein